MNKYKKTFSLFSLTSLATIILIVTSYVLTPTIWYFRGWEYFDDLVYSGFVNPSIKITESGDASSQYLIQRYRANNRISVNQWGNRVTPGYNQYTKSILTVGDSQLFGSGVSDQETFDARLNIYTSRSVYNGSRVNGLNLFNSREFKNKWNLLLITSTERSGFSWYCNQNNFHIGSFNNPLIHIPSPGNHFRRLITLRYYQIMLKHMSGKINTVYESLLNLKLLAPKKMLIDYQHIFAPNNLQSDLKCMSSISNNLKNYKVPVVFMLFPAAQSTNERQAPHPIDEFTSNYINTLTSKAQSLGVYAMNSLTCLKNSKVNVQSMQDTHLNKVGYDMLAHCMSDYLKNNHLSLTKTI